jgi:PadR family transcriptional regulator, regulatory protein AphA
VRTIPKQTTELTTTEAVALGVLAEGERSGYDLLKRVESSVGHIWAPAKSQLYAVLPRLVEAGLASRKTVRQTSRPDKGVYRLTPAGKQAVRAWLEHVSPRSFDELMLKVFFAKLAPRAALLRQLEDFRDEQVAQLEEYRAIEREIAPKPRSRFGYLTLRYGLALMPCRIEWIDRALVELSK